jgi:hypothetical protein
MEWRPARTQEPVDPGRPPPGGRDTTVRDICVRYKNLNNPLTGGMGGEEVATGDAPRRIAVIVRYMDGTYAVPIGFD